MNLWNAISKNWDESLRFSLAATVLWDQRESKWHMESLTGQSFKLAPIFYDGVFDIENMASDVGATLNQLQKPSDSKK